MFTEIQSFIDILIYISFIDIIFFNIKILFIDIYIATSNTLITGIVNF